MNNPDGTTSATLAAVNGVVPFSGLILTIAGAHSLSLSATAAAGFRSLGARSLRP